MLLRSVSRLAPRSSVSRAPWRSTTQVPSYLYSRRAFSVSQKDESHNPAPASNAPESHSRIPKIIAGGLALGSVFLAAYHYGFLDKYISKESQTIGEYTKAQIDDKNTIESPEQKKHRQASELGETISENRLQESDISSSNVQTTNSSIETLPEQGMPDESVTEAYHNFQVKDEATSTPENLDHVEEGELPNVPQRNSLTDDATSKPAEENFDFKNPEVKPDEDEDNSVEKTPTLADRPPAEVEIKFASREQTNINDMQEVVLGDGTRKCGSLLDDYHLRGNTESSAKDSPDKHKKDVISTREDADDAYISKDGKLVFDFLQAIHAAEERQAKLDARSFSEEKRAIKEKYEKELKDARAMELMYAEREAILDKELNKERARAAAALRSLQEQIEAKLKSELEGKEAEAEQKLKEMHDIAKAELAAAIAREKASQIEKMAEANLHINALCMAFYARSEEARQSHSVHKLALGALALEDALSKGLPIEKEIESLHTHVEGIDKDSLISLVLSSLPEDTRKYGTDALSQLNHKFDALKGAVRHFSLLPPGGGGILSHSLARIASLLKVKEVDQSGDGIESLISQVDSLLAQGKLSEAADALENGVRGSQAAEVVENWVKRARNRAIAEQALTVLQSYATSTSLI